MHFFTNSSSSTNGVQRKLTFALCCALLCASTVSGHGHMITPPIRIPPGDQNNGLTITRGPTHIQPCAGNPPGAVQSTLTAGQSFPIQWEIGAAHKGTCFIELSTDGNDGNFQVLKELDHCADADGTFNDVVPLPANATCDHGTIRFRWEALLTGELYLDCADVKIVGGSGGGNDGSGNSNSGSSAATTSTDTTATGTATTNAAATNTPNDGTGETTATGTDTTATNTAVTTSGTTAATTTASGIPTGKHGRKHGKKGRKHGKGRKHRKHGNKHGQCPFGNGATATATSGAAAASDTTTTSSAAAASDIITTAATTTTSAYY